MIISKAASWLIRTAALGLALAAVVGRDSTAKGMVFQAPPVVIIPNLMAYWAVDGDTGGMATDRSGNGNTGTYSGGATTSGTVQPVPTGNTTSFQFAQASNQFINVPDSTSLSLTGSFTLAAWVRPTLDSTVQQGIIEKYDNSLVNGYSLRIGSDEHFSFSVYSGSAGVGITTAGTAVPFRGADLNAWNHVAGVYQQGVSPNLRIFKNGNPDATTSANLVPSPEPVSPPTNGSAALQIGKDYGNNAFNGQIDEVRIYNRALTQAEVQILRDGQPAPTGLTAASLPGMNQLSWTAPATPLTGVTYALYWGPGPNNYTDVVNSINATTYDHTGAPPGVPTYYRVVAVTVMESARSNEVSSTPGPAGPPPPPPPPRTSQVGGEENPCGCGSTSLPSGWTAVFGLALLAGLTLARKL